LLERDAFVKRIDVSAILTVELSIRRHRAIASAVVSSAMMKFGEESGVVIFKGIQRVKWGSFMWTSLGLSTWEVFVRIMPLAARTTDGILRPLRNGGEHEEGNLVFATPSTQHKSNEDQ
jgi:hypothetical protein